MVKIVKMYCPNCQAEVYTKREDIDWFLLVILAIFTAGFGVLIYLAIYFDKPENRCVHCNTICVASHEYKTYKAAINHNASPEYPVNQKSGLMEQKPVETIQMGKYCPSCGAKLDERIKVNFCAYCGFDLS